MGFITMWRHGARRCLLVVGGEQELLRLIDATSIIREQVVAPGGAAGLAEVWEIEEGRAAWHDSTLQLA